MSRAEIILSSILTISLIFNIGLFVYVRSVIVQLLWVSEELGDLQSMVNSFSNHIQSVYEMEMFYGDETLQGLMEHARSFDEQLETFAYVYSLTEPEEAEPDDGIETADEEA
tara:strand:+ start:269 stop:604 length:336 start_codon:yes stop_codon:yes gene_type:complete